jgi:hypothetical protein
MKLSGKQAMTATIAMAETGKAMTGSATNNLFRQMRRSALDNRPFMLVGAGNTTDVVTALRACAKDQMVELADEIEKG